MHDLKQLDLFRDYCPDGICTDSRGQSSIDRSRAGVLRSDVQIEIKSNQPVQSLCSNDDDEDQQLIFPSYRGNVMRHRINSIRMRSVNR
jgi:hypothetical protein